MCDPAQRGREKQQAAVGKNGYHGAGFTGGDARICSGTAEKNGYDDGKPRAHAGVSRKTEAGPGRSQNNAHGEGRQQRAAECQPEVAPPVPQPVSDQAEKGGGCRKDAEYQS